MLEMTDFFVKNVFQFHALHRWKSATLKITNLAILDPYIVLLNQGTDFDSFGGTCLYLKHYKSSI